MLPHYEHIQPNPGNSFACKTFDPPYFAFNWHLHPEYELTLITQGRGRRFVGNNIEDFTEGDLVLLGPNLPHTWYSQPQPEKHCQSVVIQFRSDCWGERFFDLPEMAAIHRLLARSATGLAFAGPASRRAASLLVRMKDMAATARMIALLEIFEGLSRCRQSRPLATKGMSFPQREHDQKRIDLVMRHINQNYLQPLNQETIAGMLHLSPSAFSRFFRRMTEWTFIDFVNDLRLNHATRLLIETDLPVIAICHESGFNNLSNFNRRFREKHNHSPREYRQANREK